MTRRSVQGGYCASEGICAIEKQGCLKPDEDFRSSREMQGAPERAHGGVCLLQETIRGQPIGKCGNGDCAPNAESCLYGGDDFLTHLEKSSTCQVDTSFFGRCASRCAWSPDDCNDGEGWEFPINTCSCDNVEVGACRKGQGEVHCAVSPDACDADQAWIRPTDVISVAGFNCFLCRELSMADNNGDSGDNDSSNLNGNYGMTKKMEEKSSTGAIVGITVGILAAVTLIGGVGYKMNNKKKYGKEETVELP